MNVPDPEVVQLASLALSQRRNGRGEDAAATVGELVRRFGGEAVVFAMHAWADDLNRIHPLTSKIARGVVPVPTWSTGDASQVRRASEVGRMAAAMVLVAEMPL